MDSKLSESIPSGPLPPFPPLTCSTEVSSIQDTLDYSINSASTLGSDITLSSQSDRDSILTFTSFGTNLPRYSTIDFSDPGSSFDHWNEADEPPPFFDGSTSSSNGYSTWSNTGSLSGGTKSGPARSERRPNFVMHKLHINSRGGKLGLGKAKTDSQNPWATLMVVSRAPLLGSKNQLPRFIGGDVLQGCVDLQLDTPMNVHSIKLFLKGQVRITHNSSDEHPVVEDNTFLDHSYEIYSKEVCNDPRWNGQCDVSKNKENDGTFHGAYSFSFSVPFPTCVEWKSSLRNAPEVPILSFDPPPSFRERNLAHKVIYELGLVVTHGALKSKSKTISEIQYVPKRIPAPASVKRQAAYREDALLPGPLADPDGWHALQPVALHGQSGDHAVEVTCTLYLAKPLSYTRGTIIPCYITFSSLDIGLLHTLITPHTINCHLTRFIRNFTQDGRQNQSFGARGAGDSVVRSGLATHIAKAVWWNPAKTDTPLDPKEKHLEGEVHLPRNLSPTCDFPLFNIEYALELLSFDVPSFTPTRELSLDHGSGPTVDAVNDVGKPLAMCKVDIATFHEYGPVPVAFTTPAKEDHPVENKKHFAPHWPAVLSIFNGMWN